MNTVAKKLFSTTLSLALIGISASASAVRLNPRGTGQVLIYPYYTVNGGYATLLSVVNSTDQGKALKIRFHEAENGRVVLSSNLYLAANDVWTGVVFAPDNNSGAALLSDDPSCSVPDLRNAPGLPVIGDSRHYVPFSTADYTSNRADKGTEGFARTREGHVEVIEMGVLSGPSLTAATFSFSFPVNIPNDCARLIAAWQPEGYWRANPLTDMSPPTGGLYGAESIVDAQQGTLFSVNATALDDFSARVQHAASLDYFVRDSRDDHPQLSDAVSDVATGTASAYVPIGNRIVRADYPAARAIDAVSAVLMTASLSGETINETASASHTEWVIAAPTKRYYVDRAIQKVRVEPFDSQFAAPRVDASEVGTACMSTFGATAYDRNTDTYLANGPPPRAYPIACYDTSVVTFAPDTESPLLHSTHYNDQEAFRTGVLTVSWKSFSASAPTLLASDNGISFSGLPVFGFQVTNYTNNSVSAGVLANYSATYLLRTSDPRCSVLQSTACP